MIFPEYYKKKHNTTRWYFRPRNENRWFIAWQKKLSTPIYIRYYLVYSPEKDMFFFIDFWRNNRTGAFPNLNDVGKTIEFIKLFTNYEYANFQYTLYGRKKENV